VTTFESGHDVRRIGSVTVVRLPALVRGTPRIPAWPRVGEVREAVASPGHVVGPTADGSFLLPRPVVDRETLAPTDEVQVLVVPAVDPRELPEPDPTAAVRELMDLPVSEVCAFVSAVGARLLATAHGSGAGVDAVTSSVDDRWHAASRAAVTGMFNGEAVQRMIEVELGDGLTAALDGWTPLDSGVSRGVTARMAARHDDLRAGPGSLPQPMVRGLPTTQLHVTAGNAPAVPATSLLWAWASKGASVIKPAAALVALAADIAGAIAAVDGGHPLARHTTIAYWPGGDARMEAGLFEPGAFDRTVVWGSADAIRSVAGRSSGSDLILMRPRHAISLLSAESDDLEDAARRAVADSVVADQGACMSSLVHVVEGGAQDADAYAEVVARVLSHWDEQLPHRPSDRVHAELQNLRRGLLATASWRVNGGWPRPRSAVVRLDRNFDLIRHPGGRVVLVRSVPDLRKALPAVVVGDVSHVGVSGSLLTDPLRDDLAALGVDNVLPLGEAEQMYAGRPHDGMRVLTRLVRWVNG
jgi:acyl-CoA reductase LuxC